jgi:hypothetical protein
MTTQVIRRPRTTEILRAGVSQVIRGPRGPAGPTGTIDDFVHVQSSISATWNVNHNLGRKPVVTVLSDGGLEVEAAVAHLTDNLLQVTFAVPFTGSVRCI